MKDQNNKEGQYTMMDCLHMHHLGKNIGQVCGFHDAIVCAIHDLTKLLKKYTEMEREYRNLINSHLDKTIEFENKIGITDEKRKFICGGESDEES